ncbi:forkhead box protein M1 isoform X1 [Oreochromis niloticus]|uniref:Forkhead box protein M1 n=1 Tax=Oreochromis niloticus TaxID=8128 RepID=A0A669FAP1_ORENI|nr:forkhead box protein M1 isoform X1 [Oreochromis niloticus]XP_019202428.1 forkhead box protein M1 isoform X1 [Oreochromis niloticus]XP_019202429.1 forkhead box protein M1 isoform X1 [Oreochromis niloticus]
MRRSPTRPLILKRRKLPFHQNATDSQPGESGSKELSKPAAGQCFPGGIRIMDHPSKSDTRLVYFPETADLQSVIGALTAKGKECGAQGPNKFILLSGSGSDKKWDYGPDSQSAAEGAATRSTDGHKVKAETTHSFPVNKDVNYGPLDDSLGKMSTCDLEPNSTKQLSSKENQNPLQTFQAHNTHTSADAPQQPISERPPYSYMAMIQFAINSRKNRRMTLNEIYLWIEDNFPYYRDVGKLSWKNSIRHNLSLHDLFIRETSPDGKLSFWTIRPEANRYLTLDHVYKHQKRTLPDARKTPTSSERKMKPLLPRTDSYLVPIQLPVTPVYLPSTSTPFPPPFSQQKGNNSRGAKRVRIAPKVTQSDSPAVMISPQKNTDFKVEVKEELVCVPIKCETPKAPPKRQASSSRRKQCFVHSVNEEPVLLCHESNFFDSGVASDASTFQDSLHIELDEDKHEQESPDREFSFKTPIKSSSHLTSSTPSKPPSYVASFKVTPVAKGSQNILHLSPICAPGGPTVTPQHDNTTFSFSSTPFKDLPLFNSPRELLTSAPSRVTGPAESPTECLKNSCCRELLQGGGSTAANRSITEGLVLDTMNDSLSKILLDISFSGLDDDDLSMANISWSDLIPQLK